MSESTKVLSLDEMLEKSDVQFDEIYVPEWDGKVRIGTLTAGDMIDWVESNEGPARRTAGLRLLIKSLVDPDGNRIGNDRHLELFKKKSAFTVNKLVNAVLELNGLKKSQAEDVKNVLSEAPSDASRTVLH